MKLARNKPHRKSTYLSRARQEEALQSSQEYFRVLMENSPDAVTIINEDGTVRYESPSYERLLGFRPEDRLGNNLFERIHPDDITRVAELFAEFLQNRGGMLRAEVRAKHSDGSWRFIEAIGSNLLDNPIVKGIVVNLRDITERKKAEEALRQSEEKYRLQFENVSDVIFSYDREFRILSMSPSVKRMLGYSPEELIGKRFTDLSILAPECLELALSNALRTLEGEGAGIGEYIFIAKDGSRRYGELSEASLLFADGKVVSVLSVGRDVTDRKIAEQRLRESDEALQTSERQYRLLAENVKDVIWTVDMNLHLTYTSPSITQLTGYRHEEYMTKTLEEILTPASVEFVTNLFAEELALDDSGHSDLFRARTFEAELICKYGSIVPVEMKATALRDADGRPIGVLGVSRDITERKRAEQALRQREQDYLILLESTHDSIIVADAETLKVVFSNRHAALMFGFDPVLQDGLGVNILDFIYPEDREMAVKGFVEDLYRRERRQRYDVRAKTKYGREIWVSALATRIEFQGRVAVLLSLRDVTKEKRIEEEKQKLEEELLLAGRLAAVGELAAGVAHELNNPLAAIQGFAQLLTKSNDLNEDTKKGMDTIYGEAQRAAKITRNLLSFARKHKPERQLISLNEALEKTLELRAYEMHTNNIELSVQLQPDIPLTMADFYQLQQVFMNIIINAEQAMIESHGRGRLLVETQWVDGVIQITFTDDGLGIPEENLKRIFDPFFTTKEVGKGTGLGLSVCYGIIQAHGGRIYAQSKLGQGATFVVEIPIISEG